MENKTLYLSYLENRLKMEVKEYEDLKKVDSVKATIELYPKVIMLESIIKTYKEFKEIGEV